MSKRIRFTFSPCTAALFLSLSYTSPATVLAQETPSGLTAIQGVRVGHYRLRDRPTGCTVVVLDRPAVAGVDVRGAAPGTRETDLLRPGNTVQRVDALFLAGGSAFGLDVGSGVSRYLEEQGRGFPTGRGPVPIVPGAIIYDLGVGDDPKVRPGAECGYQAAGAAGRGTVEGSVGVGAGATVGKLLGMSRAMKSGVGTAAISLENGLIVAALVVPNAVGDVIDPATGKVVAGARTTDEGGGGGFVDVRGLLRRGTLQASGGAGENTTLAVVATNAALDRDQVTRVAQVAHDGFARAISPVHTPVDGDAVFAFATGDWAGTPDLLTIGALAADVVADAIVRAVRLAEGEAGIPAIKDLPGR